jgi:EAL domain-containing protein (putative c-di-GMP-specific phosphodiesterase class I)
MLELEIAKTLVANMLTSRGDRQILHSVVDRLHNFLFRSVAEDLEDRPTFDALKAMRCDVAQGYLFHPVLSYAEFVRRLQDWSVKLAVPLAQGDHLGLRLILERLSRSRSAVESQGNLENCNMCDTRK